METLTWLSLIPPVLAIALAMIFRRVVPSLLIGIVSGALISKDGNVLQAISHCWNVYLWPVMSDSYSISIIVFAMFFGVMMTAITRSGGGMAMADLVIHWAKSVRSTQLVTWALGILIFFDDFANLLIAGGTMRPVTDRFKISREKLAYIIDSTAAPICTLFVSTWIGYELGLIQLALEGTGYSIDPFTLFLSSVPSRFYAIFALIFVAILILTKRDFGPMYKAERRARTTGQLLAPNVELSSLGGEEGNGITPTHWVYGLTPILVAIVMTLLATYCVGVYLSFRGENLGYGVSQILSNITNPNWGHLPFGIPPSVIALVTASLCGMIVSIVLPFSGKIFKLGGVLKVFGHGFRSMIPPMIVLILAWSLGAVTRDLKTAEFLVLHLTDSLPLMWFPAIVFGLGAFISLATGTSFGTMAILMPLSIPLCWALGQHAGLNMEASLEVLSLAVSAVLAGSIWGDHCSPISDTTILSSMASSCNHIDHVRTQMPYAIVVGIISVIAGYIPVAYGAPVWASLILGIALMILIVRVFGHKTD